MKRLPTNRRERQIAEQYLADGWEVLKNGWPDFLMIRDGKIKLVEVKPKRPWHPKSKGGLSIAQRWIREILSDYHDYEVVYVD